MRASSVCESNQDPTRPASTPLALFSLCRPARARTQRSYEEKASSRHGEAGRGREAKQPFPWIPGAEVPSVSFRMKNLGSVAIDPEIRRAMPVPPGVRGRSTLAFGRCCTVGFMIHGHRCSRRGRWLVHMEGLLELESGILSLR
jgi:hypothetical protein